MTKLNQYDLYDEGSIKAINPKEHIYLRPSLYMGVKQWDDDAVHTLIQFVLENMVDPMTGNNPSTINIVLKSKRIIVIEDDGNGLQLAPFSRFPNSETPALVRLLSGWMPTGQRDEDRYKEYGFLSYFAMILNVVSEHLKIDTVYKDEVYTISCSKGDIISPLTKTDRQLLKSGTRITFEPDKEHFPNFRFDVEKMQLIVDTLHSQHPNVLFDMMRCK